MKALWLLLLASLILQSTIVYAGVDEPLKLVKISGKIGDFSEKTRTYEINGMILTFDHDVVIQDQDGKLLDFSVLQGGVFVDIVGEMFYLNSQQKVIYKQIIVSEHAKE